MFSKEFEENDKKMTNNIEELKQLIETAENDGFTVIDGKEYGSAHIWREVAEIALELANEQEWFDRDYERENGGAGNE
ncbi:hypothetical protein [Lactobacillus sp. PSON]|uniref:hypothetical protein n=1 Tax=Lactobacillus sp. PSON TaxID=3455454 RepID=UPI0040425870